MLRAGQVALVEREAGASIHAGDLLLGEAKTAMRMLLAQELEVVRREVDDQQPAAGRSARAASPSARSGSSR